MKFIILIILLLSINLLAQDIPDDVNTIIITQKVTPKKAFKLFGKFLIKNQYDLNQVDNTFMILSTKPKNISFGFMDMQKLTIKIIAEILESPTRIKLTSYFVNPRILKSLHIEKDFANNSTQSKNTSGDNSSAFELLNDLAVKFDSTITYKIEKAQ